MSESSLRVEVATANTRQRHALDGLARRGRFRARISVIASVAILMTGLVGCIPIDYSYEAQMREFSALTGLSAQPILVGSDATYLRTRRRGHDVLYRPQTGVSWLRVTDAGRQPDFASELGFISYVLTDTYASGGPTLSAGLKKLLLSALARPLDVLVIVRPNAARVTRVDVWSDRVAFVPDDAPPKQLRINARAGDIYTADAALADRLKRDASLLRRLRRFRASYLRVDAESATFLFSGDDADWAAMVRIFGGHAALVTAVTNCLIDIVDLASAQ